MQHVGFLIRLVAYIIDAIILAIGQGILMAIFGLSSFMTQSGGGSQVSIGALQIIGFILILVWDIGYFVYFWSSSGQTPGKMIMGIKVVSVDGGPVSVGKAIVRLIGYAISGIVIYLGFLWIIWDKEKQGWHDKIAGTYVVKT